MSRRLREIWREFREAPVGQRFRRRYRLRRAQRERGEKPYGHFISLGAAFLCCAIAVPLMFTPGPAIIFWALACFLVAGESGWLARAMDWAEVRGRRLWRRFQRSRQRRK